MEENQKNKDNKQEVSEMENNPQEAETERYLASFACGYRFRPTDEELIIHYLKPKNLGQPLPPNKIKEVNLYHFSPQQLYETYTLEGEKMVYFFTPRDRKYPRGTRPSRSAADGFWKATGADVLIGDPKNPIGYRKTLVYYEGNSRESTKTNWVMQEYTTQKSTPSTSRAPQNMTMDGLVLCRVYNNSAKEETNPGQSDLESPLSAGTLPPGLDHVNSQRPAHTGESSFPKPQLYQNPLASVKPQPPGLHNFNHSMSAHTGGYRVPMPCSNQDLLSTRPPPSEMSNIHSWMPGNSGQTPLHKPDQPGFQNVNSQIAAHNAGESYWTNPPVSAHTVGYRVPMPHSNQDLPSTRPPTSEMYNTPSWMSGNSGQTFLPKPDQPGFQDPLLLNNAHPSGMYNTYSHMPQFPPLDPNIPHFSGMFNRHPHLLDNAHMYGNTGHNSFPKPQTNQDHLYSKSPRLPDQTNQDQPGFQNVNSQMAAHNTGESYCHIENRLLPNIVPHGELPSSVLKPQSNQDLSLPNGYNTNDFIMSKCNGQLNGYDCVDYKYSQDLSTGLVHDLATESLFMDDEMLEFENLEMTEKQDFPGVPADMTEFEVPLPDYDFSPSDGFFDYPELLDSVPGDKAKQVP